MKTNEFAMDVIGNNIANVNTRSFKSSRSLFQSQFYSTFSFGTAPSGDTGGSNPLQVGTGSTVGSVTRDFSGGAPETTGNKTDLAIQGQGVFIIAKPSGAYAYTRDGSFQFNAENYLLTSDGNFLQGYGTDSEFNIVEGTLTNLRIPIGEITTASTTSYAQFSGDLNAGGEVAALRPVLTSDTSHTFTDGNGGPAADASTLLTDLYDGAIDLFTDGNIITLAEANKGGANLPAEEFIVGTTGTTYGHFAAWLEDVLGINTSADLPDLTASGVDPPGVTIELDGSIKVVGNLGEKNEIILADGSITASKGSSATLPGNTLPFRFTSNIVTDDDRTALGESIRTSFKAYDSVGNDMDVYVTLTLESKTDDGVTWRYYAESAEDTDFDRVVGTGTIQFDTSGNFLEAVERNITIDHADTGAATPQTITLDFSRMDGFAMTSSAISLLSQDGFMAGTLQDFSIGSDGIIVGSFDNGLTRNLGQVVMATFRNYEGLVAQADNLYVAGPNSGDAIIKKPMQLGAGSINSAALELSNVDLSREFINLIISSTGFSASSRVIQTSDQLLNELMMLVR
ncbi:MAG: flagellar hook-basal body complex protein [Sedimentisphaerales bacterium]|nr:flagellar hook-basal body complex protein [Sedimentisphaerales bacterium]